MLAAAQVIAHQVDCLLGLPLTADRVFNSRAWPISEQDLPAWNVLAGPEDVEMASVDDDVLNQHQLTVYLRGYVKSVDNLDDELHALTAQGLAAVFQAPLLYHLTLQGIDRDLVQEGGTDCGVVVITVRATYHVRASEPETLL
ncbi:hypothetical protein ACFJIX_17990 [Roseateles sp. UC29_93]|uniref:hypothetical protein n=1 Tax=Roseateles sp. UC29_93 TaxID=3350177 RepID=UPI00366C50CA